MPPEADGNQELKFYMIDPFQSMLRQLADPSFAGKQYTRFKAQYSSEHPGMRAFDRANSGLIFQAFQMMDPSSSPVVGVYFSDAAFSGKHMSHHPIYRK